MNHFTDIEGEDLHVGDIVALTYRDYMTRAEIISFTKRMVKVQYMSNYGYWSGTISVRTPSKLLKIRK